MKESILHIYGQEAWHDDVNIYGNRKALEDLRDAITTLLITTEHNNPKKEFNMPDNLFIKSFVNDGEGFTCFLHIKEDEEMNRLPVPYTDEMASELAGQKLSGNHTQREQGK